VPSLSSCAPTPPTPTDGAFTHGVASGDPHHDSVVLWTRVRPGAPDERVEVGWEIGDDPTIARPAATGSTTTDGSRDWTVKVLAAGLADATTYYYRFTVGGVASPLGRTRTAPSGPTDRLRFGVASCSNYGYGNFHAYRHMLRRHDLDAVIHLGDYIYEYASTGFGETYGEARDLEPRHEILTLDDYRARYGHYRADPDLQELHRQHPIIHVWDDHEFADDPYVGGAANHQPADGDWNDRVAAALQAYSEWMPTRLDGNRIFRTLDYGQLARIVGLDRQRGFL
jgi:alkaline phosphatase D